MHHGQRTRHHTNQEQTMKASYLTCWALAMAGTCGLAHADLNYSFDQDAQGFSVNVPAGTLTHEAGGYLRVTDTDGNTDVLLQLPTAAVAGGWSAYQGGSLSFDARLAQPIDIYWPGFGTITLTSAQGSLSLDVASDGEPGASWKTYTAQLDAASWGTTSAQFSAVLAGLQKVEISMEAGNGPIEVVQVDNVRVASAAVVPEASSSWMLACGLATLVGWRSRSRT
jgi:hypothetical protein